MSVDSQRAGELFEKAVQLGPEERSELLDGACGSQTELRQRVEEMLAAAAEEGATSHNTSAGIRAHLGSQVQQVGDHIGRYKLLQKIGEGGCGMVYLAEQEEPIRRRVALKVIKRGMDTRQVIAR